MQIRRGVFVTCVRTNSKSCKRRFLKLRPKQSWRMCSNLFWLTQRTKFAQPQQRDWRRLRRISQSKRSLMLSFPNSRRWSRMNPKRWEVLRSGIFPQSCFRFLWAILFINSFLPLLVPLIYHFCEINQLLLLRRLTALHWFLGRKTQTNIYSIYQSVFSMINFQMYFLFSFSFSFFSFLFFLSFFLFHFCFILICFI